MQLASQIAALQPELLRYAKLQLRNESWAEDAVSETVLAALEKPNAFENRSQLKTWLIGILKYKIIDKFRDNSREVALFDSDHDNESDALDDLLFHSDGHYVTPPNDWSSNPEARVRSQEFFVILEACMDKMPPQLGRLFLMREWLELSSDEICKELNLTATNLYVQLHRARLRLRECLDLNWFGNQHAV